MMTETMMPTTLRAHLNPLWIFCAKFSNTDAPQRRVVKGMNTLSEADTSAVANQIARLITPAPQRNRIGEAGNAQPQMAGLGDLRKYRIFVYLHQVFLWRGGRVKADEQAI